LGSQVGVDKHTLDVFVDEVLRGGSLFTVSLFLKKLEPLIRSAAKLPPWQLISVQSKVQGELQRIDKLIHIQDKVFEKPTILLSGRVSGEEEIPTGVQAVLVRSGVESPDVLSHVSVRARNAKVLLAVCFEHEIAEKLEAEYLGKWIEITTLSGGELKFEVVRRPMLMEKQLSRTLTGLFDRSATQDELVHDHPHRGFKASKAEMNLTQTSTDWVVLSKDFNKTVVGSKSLNLARLRPHLPAEIVTPRAVALPYGCFQKCLTDPQNKSSLFALQQCLKTLLPDTPNLAAHTIFTQARNIILKLHCPDALRNELRRCLEVEDKNYPIDTSASDSTLLDLYDKWGQPAAWKAICQVWSSLFGLRPWVSLTKAGRSYYELNMAVLIQTILPCSYSFVLHSRNPFADDDSECVPEMYGELVSGMGEVLVGNYEGRAMSWKMNRNGNIEMVAFPSKSIALKATPSLIFRSDSNGEDLEGFAGAGLFESISAEEAKSVILRHSRLRLLQDSSARIELLKRIGMLAFQVADVFGCDMDIEGVVLTDDRLGIVQARPQV